MRREKLKRKVSYLSMVCATNKAKKKNTEKHRKSTKKFVKCPPSNDRHFLFSFSHPFLKSRRLNKFK